MKLHLKPILKLILIALLVALLTLAATARPLSTASLSLSVSNPVTTDTLFAKLLKPFAEEALLRRQTRAKTDADYAKRVDASLATGRINFLLFGYGETFEPPFNKALIGSYTLVSFNMRTGQADLLSLTHDIRAPEVERELTRRGLQVHAVKIDQAYDVGGFDLMRRTIEDATGLPVDFQISFKDVFIRDFVDQVFGQIPVEVPVDFDTAPFYLDGQKYETAHFAQGAQRMNGAQAIQFMKSLESSTRQALERNTRKQLVFVALLNALSQNCSDRGFWLRVSGFMVKEQLRGTIAYDFDPVALVINNIGGLGSGLPELFKYQTCSFGAPRLNQTKYIVDPGSGGSDGGVRWAQADATLNPITRRDIDSEVYEAGGLGVAVPLDGNPYGDLVTDYWSSVRALVKQTMLTEVK